MMKKILALLALPMFISASCSSSSNAPSGRPPTTVKQTLKTKLGLSVQDLTKVSWNDLGIYTLDGPGEKWIERNDLGVQTTDGGTPNSFLYITHLSDTHLVDFQSPKRLVQYANPLVDGAFKTEEGYSINVLDRLIYTINELSSFRQFNAVVLTGDGIDSNQYNELKALLDVFDGNIINPNSGGYTFGGDINICQPLDAVGLDQLVPWYFAFGNHDLLYVGNELPVSREQSVEAQEAAIPSCDINKAAIGTQSQAIIKCVTPPLADLQTFNPFTITDPYAKAFLKGVVNANPDRRHITHYQYLNELFTTTSSPKGHGLQSLDPSNDAMDYAVYLDPGVNIVKLIAIDTTYQGAPGGSYSEGYLYPKTFDFLKAELEKSKAADELVIIASHHPSYSLAGGGSGSPISEESLVNKLLEYPNVILHMVGHGHVNKIRAHTPSLTGQSGYWEVQTTFTIGYPQQARLMEFVNDGDGTGTMYMTMLDHDSVQTDPATGLPSQSWYSRQISIRELQVNHIANEGTGTVDDRNAKLKFAIPAGVKARLANLPVTPVESLNFDK